MEHRCSTQRPLARWLLAIGACLAFSQLSAVTITYTLDGDFDLGTLDGVNHTAPNNHQLQLNAVGTTFPVLWNANAGEDTLSKIDTSTNKELARYRTWFGPAGQPGFVNHLGNAYAGAAPSRTAVDINGNAYVANRHFDGKSASVMKILSDSFIDRNGNGVADTSQDTNNNGVIDPAEIMPMGDTNGNGRVDPAEITDERVAWIVYVGVPNGLGRSLCIGKDGNLWVGLFNTAQYYKISSVDGSPMVGPIAVSWSPYGCLVDSNGMLWSASLGTILGKIDTNTLVVSSFNHGQFGGNYGIALGNGKVYVASLNGRSYIQFDPTTNTFTTPAAQFYTSYGIAVDGSGNIVPGNVNSGGVTKFAPDGTVIWSKPAQPGTGEVRGAVIDANNDVWLIHRTSNNLSKYKGTDGTSLGVFPIGNSPYTYSDATGFAARNITSPTGTWTAIYDSNVAGMPWGKASWTETLPTGATIEVRVRTADTLGNLPLSAYSLVSNNTPFNQSGRYIQVQARLTANADKASPILYDLTLSSQGTTCDVDGDGDIDRNDINAILAARNTTAAPGDSRDADGNGFITVNDGRMCTLKCTRPNCAP
ncbi:hypothetical protein [Chitinivorax sp. B]|uniref:hypothetical protein n=1 Tax=Chitinivorax sp. B TaxID=2502235 RepID=UPI0010F46B02|nr:hypothetical protein [Chitinivorax sp. B]